MQHFCIAVYRTSVNVSAVPQMSHRHSRCTHTISTLLLCVSFSTFCPHTSWLKKMCGSLMRWILPGLSSHPFILCYCDFIVFGFNASPTYVSAWGPTYVWNFVWTCVCASKIVLLAVLNMNCGTARCVLSVKHLALPLAPRRLARWNKGIRVKKKNEGLIDQI